MPKSKYNILVENKVVAESSPAKSEDISLAREPSLTLLGTKYPEPRTRSTFDFISTSQPGLIKLFFITISHSRPNGIYYGFDSSEGCVVVSSTYLETGRRYGIYGRLRNGTTKLVHCIAARELCHKTLCYEMF